jgi:hypothetical protein
MTTIVKLTHQCESSRRKHQALACEILLLVKSSCRLLLNDHQKRVSSTSELFVDSSSDHILATLMPIRGSCDVSSTAVLKIKYSESFFSSCGIVRKKNSLRITSKFRLIF